MDVSIIIVNYNTKLLLKNCIESILKLTKDISFEIIVSDNNSTDGSIEEIKQNYPSIKLIVNNENLGFGKANNKALEIAKGKYIFYLNSDTILLNNAIKYFFDYFEKNSESNLGALGCNLVNSDNSICFSYGSFGTVNGQIKYLVKLLIENTFLTFKKIFFRKEFPNVLSTNSFSKYIGEVDYLCGADLFLPNNKDAFFDPFYFLYYEEVDLQYQLHKKNLKRKIIDGPQIIHLEGGSERKIPKKVLSLANVSQLNLLLSSTYFFKKNFNLGIKSFVMKFLIQLIWINPFLIRKTRIYSKKLKHI